MNQSLQNLMQCFDQAAKRYNVNNDLLVAIAKTESNLLHSAINVNGSKSVDVGVMQINSYWWPILAEYEIYPEHLLDPCTNINVGAWILAQSIDQYGATWRAVGSYNAGTGRTMEAEDKRREYVRKVYRHFSNRPSR